VNFEVSLKPNQVVTPIFTEIMQSLKKRGKKVDLVFRRNLKVYFEVLSVSFEKWASSGEIAR
jgi:hypothetical protein